jgi:hypothetical protein
MQMKASIETTLSALAHIDNGSLTLGLDDAIYSDAAVRAFTAERNSHFTATVRRVGAVLTLELVATDPRAARLQIGNALTELLKHSLRERQ